MRLLDPILIGPDWPLTSGRTAMSRSESVREAALRAILVDELERRLAGLSPHMIPVEDWESLLERSRSFLQRVDQWLAVECGVRVIADYVCRNHEMFDEPVYDSAIGVLAAPDVAWDGGNETAITRAGS